MTSNFASIRLALALSLVTAACGGSPLDPGAGNDAGGGTKTLLVEGRINAEPNIKNSTKATDFTTEISVQISLSGVPVTTGSVKVDSRNATTNLTFEQIDNNAGRWVGTAANYDEVYQLDIIAGDDEVRAVIVDGPDIHEFTKPTAGASLDSTVANVIEWDRGEEADTASFRTEEFDRISIPDSGSYSLAPGGLKAEKDQSRTDTLEIRRSNSVVPSGAVPGSNFTVTITQELDVVVLPNPAL